MADKRISGLTAMTTASKDDILLVVDDPAGTPTNKKITIEKLQPQEITTLFNSYDRCFFAIKYSLQAIN